ncbi:hypothetical protein ICS_05709 [Bacillus cereus BAG2O-3]|nr:hypothetical protein ICS_05709 [Bacillus cereus BAG2O-3]
MMTFDLKRFRQESLNMSQSELADRLEISRDKIVRIENEPGKIELDLLLRLARVAGVTLEELTGYTKKIPNTFSVMDNWQRIDEWKKQVQEKWTNLSNGQPLKSFQEKFDDFLRVGNPVKPRIALFGMSDAGKTTFINSLLGSDELPAYWTPATSTNVHIKHINDRPSTLTDTVFVFENENNHFQVENINDPSYFETYIITTGGIDLLKEFGTRKGKFYNEDRNLLIVTYLDKEILNVCDLIDVPGFGTGDRTLDTTIANATQKIADIVIYLSPSNAFLRGEELQFLRNTLNTLDPLERKDSNIIAPLGNFYVVASQAMAVDNGNLISLQRILEEGAERLYTDINPDVWTKKKKTTGYDYPFEVLHDRFFTFAIDKQTLRNYLEIDLKRLLETIPTLLLKGIQEKLSQFFMKSKSDCQHHIEYNELLLKRRDELQQTLEEMIKNMPHEERVNESLRKEVLSTIRALKLESIHEFQRAFQQIINEEHIVDVIKTKGYRKKKDDIQRLSGYISGELESKLEIILETKAGILSETIEEYLKKIDHNLNSPYNVFSGAHVDNLFSFNAKTAFASGLAGLATFGALAFWASNLGNLGGYILITQAVSILSSIGISIGGTAAAVTAVSAIGGPVTLGIALAVIATVSTFAIASGTWKTSLSKKIVKEYNKKNALEQYENVIHTFWNATETAFEKADDAMKEAAKKRVETLKHDIDTLDETYLMNQVKESNELMGTLEEMIQFLSNRTLTLN